MNQSDLENLLTSVKLKQQQKEISMNSQRIKEAQLTHSLSNQKMADLAKLPPALQNALLKAQNGVPLNRQESTLITNFNTNNKQMPRLILGQHGGLVGVPWGEAQQSGRDDVNQIILATNAQRNAAEDDLERIRADEDEEFNLQDEESEDGGPDDDDKDGNENDEEEMVAMEADEDFYGNWGGVVGFLVSRSW